MAAPEERTVTIPNMSCGHCTATIQRELAELAGVQAVSADLARQSVRVAWSAPATWDDIERRLVEIGFAPAD
jgi:copper chaperone CopZ